jgi:hypothetical protein
MDRVDTDLGMLIQGGKLRQDPLLSRLSHQHARSPRGPLELTMYIQHTE